MKKSYTNNNFNIIVFLLTIFILFIPIALSNKFKLRKLDFYEKIVMKLKGDTKKITFYTHIVKNNNPTPTLMVLNGEEKDPEDLKRTSSGKYLYSYKFLLDENIAEIIFDSDSKFVDCSSLFADNSYLLYIDLTDFDTSSVTNMKNMFSKCTSLTSIEFGNFITSEVTSMDNMFISCSSIEYLVLTSFRTEKLTSAMSMFKSCSSLVSVDISTFDVSHVKNMASMFESCTSLISLTLENFDAGACTSCANVFLGVSRLKYCQNDNTVLGKIDINQKGTLVCSDPCFTNDLNLFSLNSWECVSDCDETDYKYEYNFQCYGECPEGTHLSETPFLCEEDLKCYYEYLNYEQTGCISEVPDGYYCNDTKKHTIDLCNEICEKCTLESAKINKCTSCNNAKGFYQKEDDVETTFDCFNIRPSGYYLDDNIYRKCFDTCEDCTSLGNEEDQKCTKCFDGFTLSNGNCNEGGGGCAEGQYSYYDEQNELKCTEDNKCPDNYKSIPDKMQCLKDCSQDGEYIIELNNECVKNCPDGYHEESGKCIVNLVCEFYFNYEQTGCENSIPIGFYCNDTTKKTIDKCDIKCKECTLESTQKKQCSSCNNEKDYFQKENDESNEDDYVNCYKGPIEGYYIQDNILISCYKTCKTCEEKGTVSNHKCKSCIDNHILDDTNCYENCNYYHYFDDSGEYICTDNQGCPGTYPKLIAETNECIKECSGEYKYEYENKCYKSCPSNTYYNFEQTGCIVSIPKGFYCNDTTKKTIDKCDIKCGQCSLESTNKGLCNSCNNEEDYYEKENDNTNIGSFINCYKGKLDGYFFDETNSYYKKCYKTCKSCDEVGEIENHKCTECYNNSTKNDSNCYEKCDYFYYFDESKEHHCTQNENCPTNYPKKVREKKRCISKCIDDDEFKLESNSICYQTCPEGTKPEDNMCVGYLICPILYNYEHTACLEQVPDGYYINDTSAKTIDKCNIKCKKCSPESNEANLCLSCNTNNGYYPKEDDTQNSNGFINCYNTLFESYYLDTESESYKKCYNKCKKCEAKGDVNNHKCSQCFQNFTLNGTNCYEICNYKYYFDSSNEYHCTEKNECPSGYKLIQEKNKCINNCNNDDVYKYEFNNTCYKEPVKPKCTNDSIYINKNTGECLDECNTKDFFNNICGLRNNIGSNQDLMIQQIESDIKSGLLSSYLSSLLFEQKKDLLIKDSDINYQISTTNNQLENNNYNISSTLLGDCEDTLKTVYNIDKSQPLIIFKIDYYQNNSLIPILGYEVFHPTNYSKLNLMHCENNLFTNNYPITLEDDFFKYDPNSDYYIDECYPYTTEDGSDILLEDRQKEYNSKNYAICENNCAFIEYSQENQKSECICEIKNEQIIISEINNNPSSYNFEKKDSFSSIFSTMKCYNTLFSSQGVSKNISFYLLLLCFISTSVSSFFFYKYGYNSLIKIIENILLEKEKKTENDNFDMNEKAKNNEKFNQKYIDNILKLSTPKNKKLTSLTHKGLMSPDDVSSLNNYSSNQKSISKLDLKNEISYARKKTINITNNNKSENDLSNYNDYEINNFTYRKAIESDKRTYFIYYISLIKTKHPLIFSFYNTKDFNSMIIKINIFLLSFCIYYFINGLFINNTTIHKVYEEGGNYKIGYFFPKIIISFLISHVLTSVIKYFFLSEKNINDIKNENNTIKLKDKVVLVKKTLVIKYICFFAVGSAFELLSWYSLSAFSSVYHNTQIILIKNTLIAIAISFVYPFIINLIPGLCRIYSLKDARRRCLYNFSKILQIL